MTDLRVMTWNLWWRFGDWSRRRDAIAAVLADVDADLVGLQEVWSMPDGSFADELAASLGLHVAFAASPRAAWWQGRIGASADLGIGNAVLSRWPILSTAQIDLPAGPVRDAGRTAVCAVVDAPSGPLAFVSTQLDSDPAGSATRCEQVRALADFVQAQTPTGAVPVVTGDLNAEPDSDEVRLLGGHLTAPAVPGLVLVDAWRWAPLGDPGWTWRRDNPYAGAGRVPDARIDYVLLGAPVSRSSPYVVGTGLAGLQPVDGVVPSDHAAVVVDLVADG